MSYVPAFTQTISDGNLQIPSTPQEIPLYIGVSSAGTVATLYYETNGNTALSHLGYGPLTDDGLPGLEAAGAAFFLKLTGSVAAVLGAVTATRVGTSVGTITLTGTAYRDYRLRVVITATTAALGSGKFKFSLDNGNTYSEELTIPSGGTYTIPNSGVILTFNLQAGTPDFEVGDVHTSTCTCAHWNTTNLAAGITALLASPLLTGRKIRKVFFTGIPATASAAATNAAAIATHMSTLQGLDHFARAMMDCGSLDTAAGVLTDYVAAFSDSRVFPVWGRCERTAALPTAGYGLPMVSPVGAAALRAIEAEISENLGRVKSGPLRGVKSTTLEHDENISASFAADNKINTLRTHRNKSGGAYLTNAFLKSPAGSDFKYWDYGVTLDTAAQAIKQAADNWLLEKLRAMTDGTGNLNPVDAERVKQSVEGPLASVINKPTISGLDSHVSAQELVVETNYDFLTTAELRITYRMIPTVPVEGGTITLGLTRSIAEAA